MIDRPEIRDQPMTRLARGMLIVSTWALAAGPALAQQGSSPALVGDDGLAIHGLSVVQEGRGLATIDEPG